MTKKPLLVGVSLVLVVGVVIGAVVVANNRHGQSSGSSDKSLSANMKALQVICEPTRYQERCMSTFGPVADNSSAGPKDYLKAAVVAAMEEVKQSLEKPGTMMSDSLERIDKMALDDCKVFIQDSIEDLQKALAMLDDKELHEVHDLVNEFRNWLTASIAFMETCHEQFRNPDLKARMRDVVSNATQLTSNALAIFTELSKILVSFNIPLNLNPKNQRRLLDVADHVDEDGYPYWLSKGGRRLLQVDQPKPNVVVAKDGSGQFDTITAALASYPENFAANGSMYVIYVKAGVYNEVNLTVSNKHERVFMYGDGPEKTIIDGDKDYARKNHTTTNTASLSVRGNYFMAKSIGFRNSAGPEGEQAVALYVKSNKSVFFNCKIEGYQDTLYANAYLQFYRDCVISGTIDFVFGKSATVIQNSLIIVRKPLPNQANLVSADGLEEPNGLKGLVFQNCTIVPEKELLEAGNTIRTFLGRPWKPYSTAVFMESNIEGFIDPRGWSVWNDTHPANNTCFFAEYKNRGPGARTDGRVSWMKIITDEKEVLRFTPGTFIEGGLWLNSTGIPHSLGFLNA